MLPMLPMHDIFNVVHYMNVFPIHRNQYIKGECEDESNTFSQTNYRSER